ncbi:FMN-binding glutamate synthase family protein [Marinicella sp. S1101]|uniref:FMN-binding glutamate synthase family protein n=1 Tax=Marinicella marina TaxID=2996016 RepID=UPI002260CB02|nr:FMN-binding glutamate synthase family protein [Marinicella marina]MCX7552782.1 FMN-binding glutamate synthase family protein [Marinicella marina]MDJ1139909.1 FMN-binding glutamate synthase family protein [Marinicella marina]
MTVRQKFVVLLVAVPVLVVLWAQYWPAAWWSFVIIGPLALLGLRDMLQKKRAILRLYPVIGHFRYLLESFRVEIQQYFIESDLNGSPVPREFRSLVYQRAKGDKDTRPFGTIMDVNEDGYEWINHSVSPIHLERDQLAVKFGGESCQQPYHGSPMNISAMSYGSLSKNAIEALNLGAKQDQFAHNTGEGGISPYHLKHGGDLIFQFGTGYFGCRNAEGGFDADLFKQKAALDQVKMIEIKLSQGAKPGHGGILPAVKLTAEIAEIRHVPMGKDVLSPPYHTAFDTPTGLLQFVQQLRELSGGKPIGFKLCLGKRSEFLAICKAMLETGIKPDFITVDGSEGGTGAAPIEFTNSVGTPLKDALIIVNNALIGCGLRDEIKVIAAGKIISAFHLIKAIALGADAVNSARGMMFALGCIQSRACNTDHCPTGIATQDPARVVALDVGDKAKRVARYHHQMMKNLAELLGAAGVKSLSELKPSHIMHRVQGAEVKSYEAMFPTLNQGALLAAETRPESWSTDWQAARADHW